jgi:hypothetical protein
MAQRQVFYDPSGRRGKRFRLAIVLFVLLNILTVAALAPGVWGRVGQPRPRPQ